MKNLLSPSTKAKIGAGLVAMMALFGVNSCNNSTSPSTTPEVPPHPDKIGVINGVEIRASFAITPEQEANLLERLTTALNQVQDHLNFSQLNIIEVTGLEPLGNLVPAAAGTLRGILPNSGSLASIIWSALEADWGNVAHNATEEEIFLADLEKIKTAGDATVAAIVFALW